MSLWKESTPNPATPSSPTPIAVHRDIPARDTDRPHSAGTESPRRIKERSESKESVIGSDLSIEGKIEGSGNLRIAGRFKGDVRTDGNLTIDHGAHLTGQVSASVVTVGGELHGNIINAQRVELLESGVIAGDVKASSLIVAAGSRMRGQVEFGWDEKGIKALNETRGTGSGA